MGRAQRAAANCYWISVLLLSVVAAVVTVIGLGGAQSACRADFERYASIGAIFAPGAEVNGSGVADYGAGDYESVQDYADSPQEWGTGSVSSTEQLPDFAANLSAAISNSTRSRVESFLSKLANTTHNNINSLFARQSAGFLNCARTYSLSWWAWVSQLLVILMSLVAGCSGSCRQAMGLPILLFTATVVVLDMVVCNKLFDSVWYGTVGGFQTNSRQTWENAALTGFILASISNYGLLFGAPCFLMRPVLKAKIDKDERAPLREEGALHSHSSDS